MLENHASFLGLDNKKEDSSFVYQLFDKRDKFPFFVVRMPHMSSKIPSKMFYGPMFSELLRIARCSLRINGFIREASDLFSKEYPGQYSILIEITHIDRK